MSVPKGYHFTREQIARRVASFKAHRGRRKAVQVINGEECFLCPKCREYLPKNEYHPNKKSPDGIKSQCKKCHQKTARITRDHDTYLLHKRKSESVRRSRKNGNASHPYPKSDLAVLTDILGNVCLCCGSDDRIQLDHVIPLSKGGIDHPVNFQPLCKICNEKKQARSFDYRNEQQKIRVDEVWPIELEKVKP